MTHEVVIETDVRTGRSRAVCSCGTYRSKPASRSSAASAGQRHVTDAGDQPAVGKECGKQKYDSKMQADQVILSAKIARSLKGNSKRAEVRSYWCSGCQAWHTTSMKGST